MQTRIVDVGDKPHVRRRAIASGFLRLRAETVAAVRERRTEKGDVLTVAAVAALHGVKRTPEWLPLCHPLPITSATPEFHLDDDGLRLRVTVETTGPTGCEMEALTAVAAGLLCAWDMVKPLEKDAQGQYPTTRIERLQVESKEKGQAGGASS